MEKSNSTQVDIEKIDEEGEYILQSIREGNNITEYFDSLQSYCEKNKKLCSNLILHLEFKSCYYVFKKLEKILIQILKMMKQYACKFFPVGDILLSLIETPDYPEKTDLKPFMISPIELYKQEYPEEDPKAYEVLDYILRQAIICSNNCGVIYMMRSKCQMALGNLIRAGFARFQYLNDYNSIFQQGILMLNIGFCFKNLEKYEEAGQLINKGIIILEYIEKVVDDHGGIYHNYLEKDTVMLTLLEFLFNKSETSFQACKSHDKDRMTYLLSISYKYYGEVLNKQRRTKEAEFCFENSKTLFKAYRQSQDKLKKQSGFGSGFNLSRKISSNSQVKQQQVQQQQQPNSLTKNVIKKHFPQQNQSKTPSQYEDNFSHASFRTVNTVTTTNFKAMGNNSSYMQKENIIFQKYAHLNNTRYKIVVVQIKEFNCVQVLLYNKPLNVLKKVIIGFQALLEYSQKMNSNAFDNQDSLNEFFKELIRKMKIVGGNIYFKDIQYFQTIEQFQNQGKTQQSMKSFPSQNEFKKQI